LYQGKLYFTNLAIFRTLESDGRGDPMEGKSVTIRQDVRCNGSYLNPIFVWCGTMETDPYAILSTWKDRDTVVQVTDPLTFMERVRDAAVALSPDVRNLLVGPITYDKDEGSHRGYHWAEGIFQKNLRFNGQKEFRLALVGDLRLRGLDNVDLSLGDCRGIARIMRADQASEEILSPKGLQLGP